MPPGFALRVKYLAASKKFCVLSKNWDHVGSSVDSIIGYTWWFATGVASLRTTWGFDLHLVRGPSPRPNQSQWAQPQSNWVCLRLGGVGAINYRKAISLSSRRHPQKAGFFFAEIDILVSAMMALLSGWSKTSVALLSPVLWLWLSCEPCSHTRLLR